MRMIINLHPTIHFIFPYYLLLSTFLLYFWIFFFRVFFIFYPHPSFFYFTIFWIFCEFTHSFRIFLLSLFLSFLLFSTLFSLYSFISSLFSYFFSFIPFLTLQYVGSPFLSDPLPILYLGLFTTGVCNFLQTIGQKDISAEKAAVIYSMDPVYGGNYVDFILICCTFVRVF